MNIQSNFFATASCNSMEKQTEYLCWSRMQAEAGQPLEKIIRRKELERKFGAGIFFWGVGNAPAKLINNLAKMQYPVPAIFSIMKSRPKPADVTPEKVAIWQTYIDHNGLKRDLPEHAFITSRGNTPKGAKETHYALMCYSATPLELISGERFDPSAFRNVGENGKPIGASQVTALLQRASKSCNQTDYEANLKATLYESYWVRLEDPLLIEACEINAAMQKIDDTEGLKEQDWLRIIRQIKCSLVNKYVKNNEFAFELMAD